MIDVKQVQRLVTLFETGTVTGAAQKLHMSQPTLTAHLGRLESRLGERLFLRTAKGLEPTPLGRSFYSRGKAMLENWIVFDRQISLLAGAELGELRVVCGAVIEQEILPNALLRFLDRHPGVNLQVEVINPSRMLDRLQQGEAELAIGAFPELREADVTRVEAGSQRIAFCVRPGHPLLGSAADSRVASYPMAGPQIPADIHDWLTQQGFSFNLHSLMSDSYKLLKTMAMGTDLVVGGPQFVFAGELADGSLIRLPVDDAPLWRAAILVAPAARYSKLVQALVECVRQEIAERTSA